jgi:hypothetical protein
VYGVGLDQGAYEANFIKPSFIFSNDRNIGRLSRRVQREAA